MFHTARRNDVIHEYDIAIFPFNRQKKMFSVENIEKCYRYGLFVHPDYSNERNTTIG